jgi:hypothetical protein
LRVSWLQRELALLKRIEKQQKKNEQSKQRALKKLSVVASRPIDVEAKPLGHVDAARANANFAHQAQ